MTKIVFPRLPDPLYHSRVNGSSRACSFSSAASISSSLAELMAGPPLRATPDAGALRGVLYLVDVEGTQHVLNLVGVRPPASAREQQADGVVHAVDQPEH